MGRRGKQSKQFLKLQIAEEAAKYFWEHELSLVSLSECARKSQELGERDSKHLSKQSLPAAAAGRPLAGRVLAGLARLCVDCEAVGKGGILSICQAIFFFFAKTTYWGHLGGGERSVSFIWFYFNMGRKRKDISVIFFWIWEAAWL